MSQSKADYMHGTPHAHRTPAPFLDWTPLALYDFHKMLLRPIMSNHGRSKQFAFFTFLAVDAACIEGKPKDKWEIIVSSDGPDYNESPATGPKLKVWRQNVASLMESLAAIEMAVSAPSEVGRWCPMQANVQPPAIVSGPPPAMRIYKWRALAGLSPPEGGEGEAIIEVFDP